jgi:beta-glucanase (GH16 family)
MSTFSKVMFYLFMIVLFSSCGDDESEDTDVTEELIYAESVTLSNDSITLAEGEEYTLEAITSPESTSASVFEWKSLSENVATVVDGKVTGVSRGSTAIKIIVDDNLYATCIVTVTRTDLDYELVWSDEFDADTLDTDKWSYQTGGSGWGNSELQYYTEREDNLRLEDGYLVIEAKKESYSTNSYTSARITSRDKSYFTYGRIEARISLPSGAGTWPAFWMMGTNYTYAGWPLCGEIDIMEHIGSSPTMISHAVHTSDKNGTDGNNWYNKQTLSDAENNFHTYSIEWEENYNNGCDCIIFYIDGVKSTTLWQTSVDSDSKDWPFDADFYMLLNLAVGGTMGGTVDDTIFDSDVLMKVDYVRVYQRQ